MNILLVTEDASYRLLVRKYLADEGFTLFLANDVREGMRTVKGKNIYLVITDLAMKYMDGIDFCNQARRVGEGKEIPFILVSIYDDEITKIKVDMLKNSGFIKKGRPLSEITTMIQRLTPPQEQGGGLSPFSVSSTNVPHAQEFTTPPIDAIDDGKHFAARILLVDDDDNLRLLLGDTLRTEGYTDIKEAIDGAEAIALLQNQNFNLVLLDIIMPNVSGFGVLQFIHENTPSTRVIMLTAYADMKLAVEAKQLGAADFIAKPFMRADLMKTIKHVLTSKV